MFFIKKHTKHCQAPFLRLLNRRMSSSGPTTPSSGSAGLQRRRRLTGTREVRKALGAPSNRRFRTQLGRQPHFPFPGSSTVSERPQPVRTEVIGAQAHGSTVVSWISFSAFCFRNFGYRHLTAKRSTSFRLRREIGTITWTLWNFSFPYVRTLLSALKSLFIQMRTASTTFFST